MLLVSSSECLLHVPGAQEVDAEQWAIVQQAPLKVALKGRVRTEVASRELDAISASSLQERVGT